MCELMTLRLICLLVTCDMQTDHYSEAGQNQQGSSHYHEETRLHGVAQEQFYHGYCILHRVPSEGRSKGASLSGVDCVVDASRSFLHIQNADLIL